MVGGVIWNSESVGWIVIGEADGAQSASPFLVWRARRTLSLTWYINPGVFRSRVPILRLSHVPVPSHRKSYHVLQDRRHRCHRKNRSAFPSAGSRRCNSQGTRDYYIPSAANDDSPVYHRGCRSSTLASTSSTPTSGVGFTPPPSPQSSDRKPPE